MQISIIFSIIFQVANYLYIFETILNINYYYELVAAMVYQEVVVA